MPNRVLVVEDDPLTCELIREVLSSAELEAFVPTDSTKAAAHLNEEKFDAVFLDLHTPSPNGIELARQIRGSGFNRATPIVMITGDTDPAVLARAFQAGANFLIFKPVDRQNLLRLIRVTQGPIQHERGRFARVKLRCKVTMESGQERLMGTTLDLSLNGMLVEANRTLPMGHRVQISLELSPRTPPVRAVARVVRAAKANCMGLQFENLDASENERLQKFLLPLILAEITKEGPASRTA